jgi:hypothetical protein
MTARSPPGSRTARLNLRVETLISIRFIANLPSPSADAAFPARQRKLLAIAATNSRSVDRHLAAVEADLARRAAPVMAAASLPSPVTRPARSLRVALHHHAYQPVLDACQRLRCRSALIDGELIVQDANGGSDFTVASCDRAGAAPPGAVCSISCSSMVLICAGCPD